MEGLLLRLADRGYWKEARDEVIEDDLRGVGGSSFVVPRFVLSRYRDFSSLQLLLEQSHSANCLRRRCERITDITVHVALIRIEFLSHRTLCCAPLCALSKGMTGGDCLEFSRICYERSIVSGYCSEHDLSIVLLLRIMF